MAKLAKYEDLSASAEKCLLIEDGWSWRTGICETTSVAERAFTWPAGHKQGSDQPLLGHLGEAVWCWKTRNSQWAQEHQWWFIQQHQTMFFNQVAWQTGLQTQLLHVMNEIGRDSHSAHCSWSLPVKAVSHFIYVSLRCSKITHFWGEIKKCTVISIGKTNSLN